MSVVEQAPAASADDTPRTALPRELELVLWRIRLLARLRQRWLHEVLAAGGALRKSAPHVVALEIVLADADTPEAERAWRAMQPEHAELAALERELAAAPGGRLAVLEQIFGLAPEESDCLQAALAIAIDPSLALVYADLQQHPVRGYLTESLAGRLFGRGRTLAPGPESALFRWELLVERDVAPGEPRLLACDRQVRDWFTGRHELDRALVGVARLAEPHEPPPSWPVDELARLIDGALRADLPRRLRVTIRGAAGSGRRTLAACVARRLGLPLLAVDADAVDDGEWTQMFVRAQRQAFLDRCALAWHGDSLARRPWPQHVPAFPVQFVVSESGQALPPAPGIGEHVCEIPMLSVPERRRLWERALPSAAAWPAGELDALAQRFRATPGDIVRAASAPAASAAHAQRSLRTASRERLGQLAQLLECPFDWDDIVIPAAVRETLEAIVFEAQTRPMFWERAEARRLFPQGRALLALFSGPPGTGKTMAAQIVAARLGLDLYRVDLSAVVSKWVGETSQNLERLLTRARSMDAVLLFDEADAIYGKRVEQIRDAQDRFANMDVSHLMVAIENYDGVVLLASNLKSNIDPAFLRRIRYGLEFPKPGPDERFVIWRKVLTALAGSKQAAQLAGPLKRIARIEATGAQIKYGALAAVFLAEQAGKPLGIEFLVRGLNRELAKEGAALSSRDQEALLHAR